MAKPVGRKPKKELKADVIRLRVTADQRADYERAAKDAGLELSSWFRFLATQAVKVAKKG